MIPGDTSDALNRRILAVAEDRMSGFQPRPFHALAELCGVAPEAVMERLRAMLESGVIRRLRQTLPTTALTKGCLVAWRLPEDQLSEAFQWLEQHDPFTGHIVLREAHEPAIPGADYRLWTTLKLPASMGDVGRHCRILSHYISAQEYACMPIVGVFTLSVGHVRRAGLPVGALQQLPPAMQRPAELQLTPQEWAVLLSFREPLRADDIVPLPWERRVHALGMEAEDFYRVASSLAERGALGRFAAALDHTGAPDQIGTGSSALFMWAVEPGQEELAGSVCGQHICMTHCYWRSGAERFGGVQIMGVVHAKDRAGVLAQKAAIDARLAQRGIRLRHTAVFWTQRARIHPSEFSPEVYARWLAEYGGAVAQSGKRIDSDSV